MLVFWSLVRNSVVLAVYLLFSVACFFTVHEHSPKEYINHCRTEHARKLLLESGLSVAEIGKAVGYSDPMAFSRFFTNQQGMSPSGFRKEYQR